MRSSDILSDADLRILFIQTTNSFGTDRSFAHRNNACHILTSEAENNKKCLKVGGKKRQPRKTGPSAEYLGIKDNEMFSVVHSGYIPEVRSIVQQNEFKPYC